MNLPAWPATLPAPLRDTFQMQDADPRMKRQRETGGLGYRRRFSAVAKTVQMAIQVDRSDLGDFDKFYRELTGRGSLPFTMPDPTTDAWPLLNQDGIQLLDQNDRPLLMSKIWVCLFGEEVPVTMPLDMAFRVSFPVVVLP
jgi:hypothetical protein